MRNLYSKSLAILALFSCNVLLAQNDQRLKEIATECSYDSDNQINFIKLKSDYSVYETGAENFLNSVVLNNPNTKVRKLKSENDNLSFTHTKYQVLYKNTPVNNAIIILHSENGKVVSVNGDLNISRQPTNSVTLNEATALQKALNKVNAQTYKWQNKAEEQHMKQVYNKPDFTYYPKGELILYTVLVNGEKSTLHYAYKFNIYAEKPLYKANVIVDAGTGKILAEENQICTADVPGTANTKYSGVQSFTVDNFAAGNYRLRETGRGLGIETYNLGTGTSYVNTDLTYTSTVWPNTGIEQLGTDAHFGCEKTYDYYFINHGRNSLDNAGFKLLSYINYGVNYNNAFWDGLRMTYGSGGGGGFIGLDICGHEVTHGLTSNTSNLIYSYESGALNESYSDIFGNSIEYYAKPLASSWILGESIGGIRNMANPNAFGDPDTYLGTNWYTGTGDNGGVHTNSGVSNFWYYLLVTGGSGTNDISNTYTVGSIGWTAASRIAFRALTVYYTPSTNYANARILSIQAAKDLYGNCSNEVRQVTNAWYAVGVGAAYSNSIIPNFVASGTSFCAVPISINFSNTTASGITYQWNFGDGSAISTATNPAHTYTANGTYSVKLKATGCLASVDSITKVSYITIATPANPTTIGASRCSSGTLSLGATGTSQLYWYSSPTGTGTPINIGTNYITPSLTTTTTYYVVNTSTNTPIFGAHTSSAVGTGGNYNTATAYNIFDVVQPCTLRTVVAYASTAGNRTIQLRNSANAVITSTVINMTVGTNTLNLNFALPVGTGFRLGLSSTSAVNLFRTSAGATMPYNIGGLVNITGTSAGTAGYYYFYYNWQVQKDACKSTPIAVTASIGTGPVLAVNSPTICNGQTANLTVSGATTYSWSSGQTTASIAVTPATTTSYTVYGTTSCTSSLITSVVVNPNPTVTVNSATICGGQSTNLTAIGATTYSWSSGQTTSSISVTPATSTSYTVTGYNGSCANVKVSNVTVNPSPTVTVNSSTICSGQSTNLTASGATTYSWSSGQTTSSISVTPATTTSYSVTGYNGTCSNTQISNVTVNPNPTVTVNSTTICSGQSTNLTATGATTYSWSSGQTTSGILVSPGTTTSYSVTGYNGSCSNVQVSNVIVNPNPTVTVNSVAMCVGQTATIIGTGATSYTFNPGSITGNPIAVSPTVTTTYTVIGANASNCSSSAIATVSVSLCTGVSEIPANSPEVISVYPNPADDHLVIYNTLTSDVLTINVYDVTGKLITTKNSDYYKEYIDVSKYAKGLYFVEILNGTKRIYKTKIVKQ